MYTKPSYGLDESVIETFGVGEDGAQVRGDGALPVRLVLNANGRLTEVLEPTWTSCRHCGADWSRGVGEFAWFQGFRRFRCNACNFNFPFHYHWEIPDAPDAFAFRQSHHAIRAYIGQMIFAGQHGLYLLSLSAALTIPSICGALESADGEDKGYRYQVWVEKWLGYDSIEAKQLYKLRCGWLHQGRFQQPAKAAQDFPLGIMVSPILQFYRTYSEQQDTGVKRQWLSSDALGQEMALAFEKWWPTVVDQPDFNRNIRNSVRFMEEGLTGLPGMDNVPMIIQPGSAGELQP